MSSMHQSKKQKKWDERKERARVTNVKLDVIKEKLDQLKAQEKPNTALGYFKELPISDRTMMGLERGNYSRMTKIQAHALVYSLIGRDVLGAAKTGSGKTLCFIITLLDRLFVERFEEMPGVGALVLSPTRELALQIFKVLQVVGYRHQFSAGLLTGGRNVAEEKKRVHALNIVVGTPGRVLQHLSESPEFNLDNLQVLVMDEADRLLDMGFSETISSIMLYVPTGNGHQTLLFSATQTTDVKSLAQLCLRDPVYVAAHADSVAPTPDKMNQNFLVVELERKLDALFMFIKKHPLDKVVVFVNTCNQAKYMYLAFSKILKKMRIPSMCLTGKMKQFRREEIFITFCRCKSAVLFCTDIAARGLDFPLVHWVIQFDCPDSTQTYIHRAGRTARAGAKGACILFIRPEERAMLSFLHQKKIPLREVQFKERLQESKETFVALVVQGLKYEAQKAFISYLRSLHFAANKAVFDMTQVDTKKFAHSLGLLVTPDLSELNKASRHAKNLPWDVLNFITKTQQQQQDAEEGGGKPENLTRRERHLKASDLFNTLQQKQRFTNKGGIMGEGEDGGNAEEDAEDAHDVFRKAPAKENKKKKHQGKNGKEAEEADDESMKLSYEERLKGISKAKKRKLLETADLRIKDLGLSTRTKFVDEEDVAGGDHQPNGSSAADAENEAGYASSSSSSADEDFALKLRQRLAETKERDVQRSKGLRRDTKQRRAGKGEKGDVGGAVLGKDEDKESNASSEPLSMDSDTEMLLKAARGELYDDDDDDDDDDEEEGDDDVDEEQEDEYYEEPVRKHRRK